MSLSQDINNRLKEAMKNQDAQALSVLRMIKSRIKEYAIANLIKDEVPDEDVTKVIGTYVKQMKKAIVEFEKGGDDARDSIANLQFEIDYLSPYLPSLMDEFQTAEIVNNVIADIDSPTPRQAGMVMGRIMKEYKGQVDAGLVRQLVDKALAE